MVIRMGRNSLTVGVSIQGQQCYARFERNQNSLSLEILAANPLFGLREDEAISWYAFSEASNCSFFRRASSSGFCCLQKNRIDLKENGMLTLPDVCCGGQLCTLRGTQRSTGCRRDPSVEAFCGFQSRHRRSAIASSPPRNPIIVPTLASVWHLGSFQESLESASGLWAGVGSIAWMGRALCPCWPSDPEFDGYLVHIVEPDVRIRSKMSFVRRQMSLSWSQGV